MASLLDTNVLSEIKRSSPNRRVVVWLDAQPLDRLYVTSVTLAEIRFGIDRAPLPEQRIELEWWLAHTVRPMFTGRVLDITEDTMLRWRHLVEDGRKTGRTYSQPDLIIAALALQHDFTLVTRNTKDFAGLGVALFNPWEDHP